MLDSNISKLEVGPWNSQTLWNRPTVIEQHTPEVVFSALTELGS